MLFLRVLNLFLSRCMLLLLGWTMIWRPKWFQSPLEEESIFICSKVKQQLYVTCWGWLLRALWSRFQHIAKTDAPSHFFFSLEGENLQRRMEHSFQAETTRAWWPCWDSTAGDRFFQGSGKKGVWGGAVLVGASLSGKRALGFQPVATALIEVSAPHIITLFLF